MGNKEIVLTHEDHIATLHLHNSKIQPLNIIDFRPPIWIRDSISQHNTIPSKPSSSFLISSKQPYQQPTRTSPRLLNKPQIPYHTNIRTVKMEASLQLTIDLPYDLDMSSYPYNNHTHRTLSMNARSPTLD